MRKKEVGQAFILVLILLAVGALLIAPALNLAFTGLKGRMAQHTSLMEYYAVDGAQEYSVWRLANEEGVAASLPVGEESAPFYIVLNDVQAEYTITVQAGAAGAPSEGPIETRDKFKITIDVEPGFLPMAGTDTFTYTIRLKYMNPDVTEALKEISDNLWSGDFKYVSGSTRGNILAGGDEIPIDDSYLKILGGTHLKWTFNPPIEFDYWEERYLRFDVTATLEEGTYPNQVYLEPNHTLSPLTAPIVVVEDTGWDELLVTKEVYPPVAYSGVETPLTYTITIENVSSNPATIHFIRDALPPGFIYAADSSSGVLDTPPAKEEEPVGTPEGNRIELEWRYDPAITINPGPENKLSGSFDAIGTLGDSGTYANELWVVSSFGEFYTWQTAGVVVPQYDIESSSGGTTINLVAVVSGGKHRIKSWVVE